MWDFLWFDLLYKPLYNALILLYQVSPGQDMGWAIILLTLTIRIMLLPFSFRAARSEHRLEKLQPVIDEVKERYKYNIEKQREATKRLLQKNEIGIFSSLLSLAFQVLVFVVLYKIFSSGLQLHGHNELYEFIPAPLEINPYFFDRFNLIVENQGASLFAAAMVFLSQAMSKMKHLADATTLDKVMLVALPLGTYMATIILPSSKAVFIAASVIFTICLKGVRFLVVRFVKDEELKGDIDKLWTS